MKNLRLAGLTFVFLWFLIGGIGHFLAPRFFLQVMPPWVPFPPAAVYLSGAAELIGAFALLSARTRPLAGILLLLVIVCVTPVHIYMLQYPERFPQFPLWALWLRILIQILLMTCVWWSTRVPRNYKSSPSK